jgi:hypothetical protein
MMIMVMFSAILARYEGLWYHTFTLSLKVWGDMARGFAVKEVHRCEREGLFVARECHFPLGSPSLKRESPF